MTKEAAQRIRYIAGDFLATCVAWLLFNIIRFYNVDVMMADESAPKLWDFLLYPNIIVGQILFPLMMVGLYYLSGYYNQPFFKSRIEEMLSTLWTSVIGCILIFFIAIINDPIPDRANNYELLMMLWALLFGFVWVERICVTQYGIHKIYRRHWKFPTLIVGDVDKIRRIYKRMTCNGRPTGYDIIGFVPVNSDATEIEGMQVYRLDDIGEVCKRLGVKNIIVATNDNESTATLELLNRLFALELPIFISPTLFHLITGKQKLRNVAGEPLVDISSPSMSQSTINLKRCGDVFVSAITLALLAPLFAVLAIAIRFDSAGPVFYRQERIGYHKRPFKILKFRTMRIDAEKAGPQLSTANDPRITRLGHLMRKYRLDELPQFWNVLIGDMSIVGPRPEREFFIRQILERAPYYALIHQVRPGITSWGMVRHGYASDVNGMIERLQYDLLYLANVSLMVDLKIMMYTVRTVVTGKGV